MSFWNDLSGVANPIGYAAGQMFGGNARRQVNTIMPMHAATDTVYSNLDKNQNDAANTATAGGDKNAAARYSDIAAGNAAGKKEFYDDPDMKALRAKREDLAKGYSGEELGAMRQEARGQTAGQRSNYLQSLQGKLARGGVGGARAAAVSGAADQKYAQQGAEQERKLALDSANMQRQGQNDLQDYIFRQKYGSLGTGLSYGQLGAQDRGTEAAIAANQPGKKGVLSSLLDGLL